MTRTDVAIKMVEKLFPDSHAFSKRYVLSVLKEKKETYSYGC